MGRGLVHPGIHRRRRPFGSHRDEEGRIFLNAQSWAIISGTANPERTAACIDSVEKHLSTPSGPMMLAPAYTRMRTDIGKLSQKCPGRLENGSVYSHAVTFYAYALYLARRPGEAIAPLRMLLSGSETNPVTRSGQLPSTFRTPTLAFPPGPSRTKHALSQYGHGGMVLSRGGGLPVRSEVRGRRPAPRSPAPTRVADSQAPPTLARRDFSGDNRAGRRGILHEDTARRRRSPRSRHQTTDPGSHHTVTVALPIATA